MGEIATTCPYCGVGCGVTAKLQGERLIEVAGQDTHPANHGRLCVKGTNLPPVTTSAGRLKHPLVRGRRVDWEIALDAVARGLGETIDRYGPNAIAFYLSGQLLTEDYYVANKLAKGFIGTGNVDTNSRLCMASAVAAHKRAFGEDVVPCNYTDLDVCDLLVLCGSNAAWTHPVIYQRIADAKQAHGTHVVVIDPRSTSSCDLADQHLALRPGTDVALFNGLLSYLHDQGRVDQDYLASHTEGFTEALAANYLRVARVAEITGLQAAELVRFYEQFAETTATVTIFSQGVNQAANGTDRANAIINCHLATGRIGVPGTGPFSVTGQPNAMGGREVGGLANQLAAHMDFSTENVAHVSGFWGSDRVARQPGLKAVEMFEAMRRGEIKAIWIMGTNPAVSLPNSGLVRDALSSCPFVVVSDCVAETDTTCFADILLPAQAWGEKDGTVTNSERCISRQRRLLHPVGEARPDWQIVCAVADRMGFAEAFAFKGPAQIFAEHASLSSTANAGQRLFDLGFLEDLTPHAYASLEPTRWPQHGRPFADAKFPTPSGRARMVPTAHREPRQTPTAELPYVLNTGRYRDQWHTMTRTGVSAKLFLHHRRPGLQIHPEDAQAIGVAGGGLVEVTSAHGRIRMIADVSRDVPPGQLFAPIHWNDRFANQAVVSGLFGSVVDPISGQPESKHAAVACRAVHVPVWLRLLHADALQPQALHALDGLIYWAASPVSCGYHYEIALERLDAVGALVAIQHAAKYEGPDGQRFVGETEGRRWLLFSGPSLHDLPGPSHLQLQIEADIPSWQKLSVRSIAPGDHSPVVCTCYEVSRRTIEREILAGCGDLDALGGRLRCGTNCGSCVPELNQLLDEQRTSPAITAPHQTNTEAQR